MPGPGDACSWRGSGPGGGLVLGGTWSGGVSGRGIPAPRGVPGGGPGGSVVQGCLLWGWGSGPGGWGSGPRGIPAYTKADPPLRDWYCCGRYASYWNAFLLQLSILVAVKSGNLYKKSLCIPNKCKKIPLSIEENIKVMYMTIEVSLNSSDSSMLFMLI